MNARGNYDGEVVIPEVSTTELEKIQAGTIGIYDVVFTIKRGEGASITVKLSVIEDDAVITPDDLGSVYAKNAKIYSSDAKLLENKEALIELMKARATYNGEVIIPNVTAGEFAQIKAGTTGIYDVTFSITEGSGASKDVRLTVIEDDSEITPDELGSVYAANKQITVSKAKELSDKEALIELMDARADHDGVVIIPDVTTSEFDKIQTGTVGIYNITFSILEGGGASKTVKLSVIEDDAVITPDDKGSVFANNTQITSSKAKELGSKEALIEIMNAQANHDGNVVMPTVTAAEFVQIQAGTVGIYGITFSITEGSGATITVKLSVIEDDATITPDGKGSVYAQNNQIKSSDAKKITNKEELIKLMNARGNYDGMVIVPNVTAKDFGKIQAGTVDIYDVTFSITNGDGASKTVKLSVVEDDAVITPDDLGSVYAENNQITSSKAKELTNKESLIELMKARATYDGTIITPNVTAAEFAEIQAGTIGIYDVTFDIIQGKGTSKTVKLSIIEDDSVITPDGKGSVYAKNTQIKSLDAQKITSIEELISIMSASAIYDGTIITPNVTAEEFAEIQAGTIGIYDVTFDITEGNGTSKTVKLSVIEDDAVVTPDDLGSIYAINKQITSKKAKSLKNKESLIDLMNAKGTYDGSVVTPIVTAEDFKTIKAGTVGIYDITFSIKEGNGASKTVKLTVTHDDAVITPDGKGYVYASDTEITSSQAKKLANKKDLINAMNVSAAYDGISVIPTVEAKDFNTIKEGQIGTYDVSFSINEGDTATSNVKLKVVKDEVIVKPEIEGTSILSTVLIYLTIAVMAISVYIRRQRRLS